MSYGAGNTGFGKSNDTLIVAGLAAAAYAVVIYIAMFYGFKMGGIDFNQYAGIFFSAQKSILPGWFHVVFSAYLASMFLIFGATIILFEGGVKMETHVSGLKIESPEFINKAEAGDVKRSGAGVAMGKFLFSRARETMHLLLIGGTGSGKSVAISVILKQVLGKDKVIVFDPKGDFAAALPEFIMYAPWDKRGSAWAVGKDLNNQVLVMQAVNSWIPEPEGSDKTWANGARNVLTGIIYYLMKHKPDWGFRDVSKILMADQKELRRIAVEGFPANNSTLIMDGDKLSKSAISVLFTLSTAVNWVHPVGASEVGAKSSFSFNDFLLTDKLNKTLVLNYSSTYSTIADVIFSLILTSMANTITSPSMPSRKPREPGTWVIIDEAPQLGKASASPLKKIMEIGRSRGVRAILAAQDLGQFEATWGKSDGDVIMSLPNTKLIGRSSAKTAKIIEDESGKRVVVRAGASYGEKGGSGSRSMGQVDVPVILHHQVTSLKPGKALLIANGQPCMTTIPLIEFDKVRPALIDNQWFLNGIVPPQSEEDFEAELLVREKTNLAPEYEGQGIAGEKPEPKPDTKPTSIITGDAGDDDEAIYTDEDNIKPMKF